ncbi:MAG: hypothetical protein JW795_13565 [Chitinivibrionales bacterium]|nr:hypothetical protein [Chitinivibrionales bacterium]
MDLSISSSLNALTTSSIRQEVTAHNVANVNTAGYERIDVYQTENSSGEPEISALNRTPNPDPELSNTDLAQEATDQIENLNAVKAYAKTVKTEDEMMRSVIDMKA